MNQFDAAKARALKRAEKKIPPPIGDPLPPYQPPVVGRIELPEPVVEPVATKEKTFKDAYIRVEISLPTGVIGFTLVKESVLANASVSRLTKDEFKRCVINGLIPLLGVVRELPRGG